MKHFIYLSIISILLAFSYFQTCDKIMYCQKWNEEHENHWNYVYKTAKMIDKHHEKYGYDSDY